MNKRQCKPYDTQTEPVLQPIVQLLEEIAQLCAEVIGAEAVVIHQVFLPYWLHHGPRFIRKNQVETQNRSV